MKLSKEELKQKVTDLVDDDEKSIELLEDIEDSFVENIDNDTSTELEETKKKYEDLKKKYKERFLNGKEKDEKEEKEEDEEELTEKKYIDIKEI